MRAKIRTIDVNALEWFDKVNGNSYFAGVITVNFGMKTEKRYLMPFQYGYGSQYETEAMNTMVKNKVVKDAEKYNSGGYETLWRYCDRKNIILRRSKKENCKQRELKALVSYSAKLPYDNIKI